MSLIAVAGVVDRWLLFAAVLVAIGAAAFHLLVARRTALEDEAARTLAARCAGLGLTAAVVALAAALGRLPLQLGELMDPDSAVGPQLRALVTGTSWGTAWMIQLFVAVLAATGFALARSGRRMGWWLALLTAAALAATPAFSGHAVGSERWPSLAVAADALHVLGAGLWLGAMVSLLAGLRDADGPVAQRLVAAFSPLALAAAATVAVTGVFSSYLRLGALAPLWQSRYGRTLLVKLGAVTLMAAAGAFNWRRAGPALQRSADARPMRRSVRAEVLIGAMVVLATAILVVTPPPGEE